MIREAIDHYLNPTTSDESAIAGLRAAVHAAAGAAPYLPDGADYVADLRASLGERRRIIDESP